MCTDGYRKYRKHGRERVMELPYERAAMQGEPMPDGLEYPDQCLYQSLRLLYQNFRAGTIDKETGKIEKGKMVYERDRIERKLRTKEKIVQKSVEMINAAERYGCMYAKERTLENADKLYHALYGIWPNKGDGENGEDKDG
jgi:hypothetical protein